MAEGVQSGPERSRARSLRRQRTLDGEDRSVTIPSGRKGSGRRIFGLASVSRFLLCAQSSPVATLPSALSLSDFVSLGASWVFSLQPVLPPDFRPLLPPTAWKLGQAIDAVTGTRRWARCFRFNQ